MPVNSHRVLLFSFFLVLFFCVVPFSFAFLNEQSLLPIDIPTNSYSWNSGLALDASNQKLASATNVVAPNAVKSSEMAFMLFDLATGQKNGDFSVFGTELGGWQVSYAPWQNAGIKILPNGEVYGLFRQGSPFSVGNAFREFAVVRISNVDSLSNNSGRIEKLYSSPWEYTGFEYFDGRLWTVNNSWRRLTGFNPVSNPDVFKRFSNSNDHISHPRLNNITDFSISSNGTVVTVHTVDGMQELLVFRLAQNRLDLIQTIPYVPTQTEDSFRDDAVSVASHNDAFFVGTVFGAVESFAKLPTGLFETRPSQRLVLNAPSGAGQVFDLVVSPNRLAALQFSKLNHRIVVGQLDISPVIAPAPVAIKPTLGQKASQIQDSIELASKQNTAIVNAASALVVEFEFDSGITQKIESQNPGRTAFETFAKNAKVTLDDKPLLETDFTVEKNRFVFSGFGPISQNQSKTLVIASKIPGFSGSGITLKITKDQEFLEKDGVIRVLLKEKKAVSS